MRYFSFGACDFPPCWSNPDPLLGLRRASQLCQGGSWVEPFTLEGAWPFLLSSGGIVWCLGCGQPQADARSILGLELGGWFFFDKIV